jgi:hypothetical protein
MPLEWWQTAQSGRRFAEGVPMDSDAVNAQKHARIDAAFAVMRKIYERAKPDVLVVFGDDQEEQFDLRNYPAFAICSAETLEGYRAVGYTGEQPHPQWKHKTPDNWTRIRTAPDLAKSLILGIMKAGFDPAFMNALPREGMGLGHAFTRPVSKLDPDFTVPLVPVMVNCYYAPQPTASRCVKMARAVRDVIATWPDHLNVVVIGSGGLWHTPGAQDAYLDHEFDQTILAHLRDGNADAAAEYFDNWKPAEQHKNLRCFEAFRCASGMEGGVGSGSGETRTWIMAAAVADTPATVIDYIPIYASPVGAGFASWEVPERPT